MANQGRRKLTLEQVFATLEDGLKDRLSLVTSPLILGIAALVIAEDRLGTEFLSAGEIVRALEYAGTHVDETRLVKAFARATGRVVRRDFNGMSKYRAMLTGRRTVGPILELGTIGIAYIDGGRPRTARRQLGDLLKTVQGPVRISDPYYGVRTLDALELLPGSVAVKFLTADTSAGGRRLQGALADFRRERPKVDMRRITVGSVPHDRYIMSPNILMIIGHGLKDIGNRESFVIVVDRSMAADLIDELTTSFEARWSAATPL